MDAASGSPPVSEFALVLAPESAAEPTGIWGKHCDIASVTYQNLQTCRVPIINPILGFIIRTQKTRLWHLKVLNTTLGGGKKLGHVHGLQVLVFQYTCGTRFLLRD